MTYRRAVASSGGSDVDLERLECRAMGTDVLVLVRTDGHVGAPLDELSRYVVDRLEHLEARWSRFRSSSDVSVLNAAGGRPVVVAPETFALVERAVDAWRVTGGAFDPTVLPALIAAGYDRDFDALVRAQAAGEESAGEELGAASDEATPTPGCGGIELDATVGAIRLPPGVAIDLGGIGKGRAADLLALELVERGAVGCSSTSAVTCASRAKRRCSCPREVISTRHVSPRKMSPREMGPREAGPREMGPREMGPKGGSGPERNGKARGWVVGIDDPLGTGATGRLVLADGAIATSSRLRRTWTRSGRAMHHLVDPRTGAPATTGLASVTVLAGSAARAEVVAKAAFVLGPADGAALVERLGLTGVLVHDDGRVEDLAGVAAFRV